MDLDECIKQGFLSRIQPNGELAIKEWIEAKHDLSEAEKNFQENEFKWATVSAYYAMFHAAKAVLFKRGFKEKAHSAVALVLKEFVKQGKLESRYADDFLAAMSARESANYRYTHSKETAEYLLDIAKEFLQRMKKFL